MTITTHSEEETAAVGLTLAGSLPPGSIVLLEGELGAGKTAFVRGMAQGLGIDPREVSSPTFTLIQQYEGGRVPLFHVDLYRLAPIEVEELGLEELTSSGGVTAIEWPDRLRRSLGESVLVRIEHGNEETRTIRIAE